MLENIFHCKRTHSMCVAQVYLGIENLEDTQTSLFRSFPGSVREKLQEAEGRTYNAGKRPWFTAAKANRIPKTDFSHKTQLQVAHVTEHILS